MSNVPRVLAAVDLGPTTETVLEAGIEEAARAGAELVVLHVHDALPVDFTFTPRRPVAREATAELERRTREALRRHGEAHPRATLPDAQLRVTMGRPADEIVAAAAHFDAESVIVGSHGRRGLARALVGSVAERVVRLAGCAVRVVRDKNHGPNGEREGVVPACPDCAQVRAASEGGERWCAVHAHRRALRDAQGPDHLGPATAWFSMG